MTTAINTMTKEELGIFLAPLTGLASKMIIAGTLRKNVVKHFTNKGLSIEVAENLTEVGVFKAEEFLKNKAK
jgi:branched-subunit amino acid aminotransferase/4-amino-4-deoxychorismate lyase